MEEDFQKTLEEAGRQIGRELREAEEIRSDPEKALHERERVVTESLEKAKILYKRKEYGRAFVEWERACAAFGPGAEEFRRKVRSLKESHENLIKVNRELVEIREVMSQRAAPAPADTKFVEGAHDSVNGKVKNVYAYLSQQLRAERTTRSLSFWWPVVLAVAVLASGFAGLNVYHSRALKRAAPAAVPAAPQTPVDKMFLEAQKNAEQNEIDKQTAGLKAAHAKEIEDLKRKNAEGAKGDREKIVQLETRLNESESKNSDLERRIKTLIEDNLNKDAVINALN